MTGVQTCALPISVIPTTTSNLLNLINSITREEVDEGTAKKIMTNVLTLQDDFLTAGTQVFDILPEFMRISIQEAFINFSNEINFKISNLLGWMYSNNNTEQFELIVAENNSNSSFANKINTTIIPVQAANSNLFTQLATFSGDINSKYLELINHIQRVILEVEDKNFVPDNYNSTAIKIHVDEVNNVTSSINNVTQSVVTLMNQQETSLNTLIFELNSIRSQLTSLLSTLFLWSEDASEILSSSVDLVRAEALNDINLVVSDSNKDIEAIIDATRTISFIVLGLSAIVIIILIILANYQISKPIKHISYWSEKISNGDLSYNDYKSKRIDEIGVLHNNFRTMNKNLLS